MPWDYDNYLFALHSDLDTRAAINVLRTSAFVPESSCYRYEEHEEHETWGKSIKLGSPSGRWDCLSLVVGEHPNIAFACEPLNNNPLWRLIVHFAPTFSTPHIAVSWPGRCFDEDLTSEQRQQYTDLIQQTASVSGADYVVRGMDSSFDQHVVFVDGVPVLDHNRKPRLLWVKEGKPLPAGMQASRFKTLENGYLEWIDAPILE